MQGQHPLYMQLRDEQGLPVNTVYQMVDDPFGMLWMATPVGLYRFDGIRSIRYPVPNNPALGMVNVFVDEPGNIWTRSDAGMLYRVIGDSLLPVLPSMPKNLRYAIPDGMGGFLTLCSDTLSHYDLYGARKYFKLQISKLTSSFITDMACYQNQAFFSVAGTGVYRISLNNGELALQLELSERQSAILNFSDQGKFAQVLDFEAHRISVIRMDEQASEVIFTTLLSMPEDRWYRLVTTPMQRIWACTSLGLIGIAPVSGGYQMQTHWFPDCKVSSILYDREGNLWVSTLGQGVCMIPDPEILGYSLPDGEAGITAICAVSGTGLLAGADNGDLYQVNPITGSMLSIYRNGSLQPTFSVKQILEIEGGILASRGKVLIGLPNGHTRPTRFSNFRDMAIAGDTLIATLADRIIQVRMQDLLNGKADYEILLQASGTAVEYDPEAHCWYFSSAQGTYVYGSHGLVPILDAGNPIYTGAITRTRTGVYAARLSGGLVQLHPQGAEPVELPEMVRDQLFRVLAPAGDTLYFATEQVLGWYHPASKQFGFQPPTAGLLPVNIQAMVVAFGLVWLGTSRGLVSLPATFGTKPTLPPLVRFGPIFLNGHRISQCTQIDLPVGSAHLEIGLEGVHFRSLGNMGFRYRLLGLDSTWTTTPVAGQRIQFSALPPGDYVLEVLAVAADGTTSIQPVRMPVHVATPFFQRTWVLILILMLVVAACGAIFSFALRDMRKRHRINQQLILSQLTAIKAQMNPHFMFNTLNSIQDLVLSQDFRTSNLYLSKFSTLMRKVLDGSGKEEVRLEDEIDMLRLYLDLEMLRFGDELQCTITVDPALDIFRKVIPSMVIQPFVENALKHGLLHRKGDKRLDISFAGSQHTLQCIIRDNGIGREQSSAIRRRRATTHTSFSTEATQKRFDLLKSLYGNVVQLEIIDLHDQGHATGTEVRLRLPFMNPS